MAGFTIRKTMVISIIALSVIIIGLIVALMNREWQNYRALAGTSEAVSVVSALSRATIELSLERSLTQVALNLDDPISDDINGLLQGQRTKSNALFEETRAELLASTIPDKTALVTRLDGYLAQIAELRQVADPILASAIVQRAPEQIRDIPVALKGQVSSLNALGSEMRMLMAYAPSDVRANDQIMQQALAIREYGGRERTIYAIATARIEPISREDLAYMLENHGIAMQAWNTLVLQKETPGIDPEVLEAVDLVAQSYFTQYDALRNALIEASPGGDYPVDFGTLFARSEEALQTAISLLNIAAESNRAKTENYIDEALTKLTFEFAVALLAVFTLVFASYFLLAKVLRPISGITDVMGRLAEGENATDVPFTHRQDEVGKMANAVEVFRQNALRNERLEKEASELQVRAQQERRALLQKMADDFETQMGSALHHIQGEATTLRDTADGLNSSSTSSGSRSLEIADTSRDISSSVEILAQNGQDLSNTIDAVAAKISETSHTMQNVVVDVGDAAGRIESLQKASEEIGDVVALITDIAGQTNLLALNATIEAARAGEAGKGFAVVASEVKNLSAQTEQATAQIEQAIRAIQSQTGNAVQSIKNIESSIQTTDQVITSIASDVKEQSSVTSTIAEKMNAMSTRSNNVSDAISYLCQSSAKSSGAAIKVLWSVNDLAQARDQLQGGSDTFLSQLRQDGESADT